MITEDYVSFETAKLLKEKGFDEGCSFVVNIISKGVMPVSWPTTNSDIEDEKACLIALPTLQMAMKWLREVHKLHISVEIGFDVDNSQYFFYIPSVCRFSNKSGEYQTPFGEKEFDTYEEACEAAIKYCLEKFDLDIKRK